MRRASATAIALLAAALGWGAAGASASTITVANNNDSGAGSLRAALAAAGSGDTIVVPPLSITLTSGPLVVDHSVVIEGAGETKTAVSGNFASRVFEVRGPAVDATLAGLQILDGVAPVVSTRSLGGGILVEEATLTVSDDLIVSNEAVSNGTGSTSGGVAEGGGIYADAASNLTVLSSLISDNRARAEGLGTGHGGISEGGAVADRGQLAIRSSAIVGNTSNASGGGGGSLAEAAGVFFDSTSTTTTAAIEGTSVTGNQTIANGLNAGATGGDAATSGVELLYGSSQRLIGDTISGNSAIADGDGTGHGGVALGGAAEIALGPSTIINVTIANNKSAADSEAAAGGDALDGGLVAGQGGKGEPVTIVNSTIDANTVEAAGASAGKAEGGNLSASEAAIENTIIAGGLGDAGQQNCTSGTAASVTSLGGNIDSLDQCGFHGTGDRINTDPLLGPLTTNGGPVETMAPAAGSPAIDGGRNAGCPVTDARGVLRPAGLACDSGAFEVAEPSAVTNAASAVAAAGATLNGTARNPGLEGGQVHFQYGTSTAYGASTAAQPVGPTVAGGAFAAAVSGLVPGNTYHFRLVVQNSVGTAFGADQTFTTATTTPLKGPAPHPSPSLSLAGAPRAADSGTAVSLSLSCSSLVACPLSITATTRETLRHGKVVSLSSRTRTVTVGSLVRTLPAASRASLTVKLNATGRRLERRFGRLPVTLSIYVRGGSKPVLLKRVHLVLRPPHRHRH